MRNLLTILFICFVQTLFGQTTYYVAANGSDANNGTSTSTPWQTTSKVNSTTLNPGDQVLFRRGDTFYGKIILPESSNSVNITFGAYGSGAKPIITGFTSVTAWTNKGGNIWESTNTVSSLTTMNEVLVNGQPIPMGKYPNGDDGYPYLPNFFNFQSHTGDGNGASSITSSSLSGGNDWTGADVVIRMNQWTFHREQITSQNGDTLNFNGVAGTLTDGWGFFIQNDIRTLDQQNEWYYNPSTKKISIYSTTQPANVQVSTIDTLIYFYSNIPTVTSIKLDNLQLTGANANAVWISGNLTFSVTNCDIKYNGLEGIYLLGGGILSGTIDGNTFYNNGSSALATTGTVNKLTITNNNVNMSAVISAIKRSMYGNGGIEFTCDSTLVQYNNIDSSAYCGINFNGTAVQVRNNFVNHSAVVRGDDGGIYTGYANNPSKIIDGNIVLNSLGNPRGAGSNDYFTMGIYSDDFGNNFQITNNVIAYARTAGIYLHNSNNLNVRNNIIFSCGAQGTETMWANGGISLDGNASQFANSVYSNSVTQNQIFATNQYQYVLNYYNAAGSNNDPSHFGVIDSNYYTKINSAATAFNVQINDVNTGATDLAGWKSLASKDANSTVSSVTDSNNLRFEYNETNSNKVVTLDQKYIDVKGTAYNSGAITLAPYSGVVLIKNGAFTTTAPTISISGTQTITVGNTSVSAVATWASGHTGTYAWTKISGPGTTTIGSPTSASTTVTGLQTGTYVLRCTITQDDSQSAYAEVTITVNIPNVPPTANAGTDQTITLPTTQVTLSGSGTDSDGSIASYSWSKVSGGASTITGASSATTTVTGLATGVYVFRLTVTDNQGATGTDDVQVTVNSGIPPVVNAGSNFILHRPTIFINDKQQ